MDQLGEFEDYLEYLCEALGHADRNGGLMDYCRGLMLPIERTSVEPLAAHTDPLHVGSKHQSLHHFAADSDCGRLAGKESDGLSGYPYGMVVLAECGG